jgi:hypothetical protein
MAEQNGKTAMVLIRALVWAMAGALFGALFAGLFAMSAVLGATQPASLILAASLSGTVTAIFYGAMKTSMVGTLTGVLVTIGYFVALEHPERVLLLLGIAAVAGLATGLVYATAVPAPSRPLARALSGLLAGTLLGAVLALTLGLDLLPSDIMLLSAIAVAGVGTLFVLLARRVASFCARRVPAQLSAPFVSAVIASTVAAGMWLVGASEAGVLDADVLTAITEIKTQIPAGLVGGAIGGAIAGILLEMAGVDWQISPL